MKRLHIASIGLAAAMALAALNVASTTYGQAPSAESTADSWGVGLPTATFTTLVSFDGTSGANPDPKGLVQGRDGSVYGTTEYTGAYGSGPGTVFKITPTGKLTTLYRLGLQTPNGVCATPTPKQPFLCLQKSFGEGLGNSLALFAYRQL